MEPIRDLMAKHLELSGDSWCELQMAEAVARLSDGAPRMDRKFRVVVAAEMELESRCLSSVKLLLQDAKLWGGIPAKDLTVQQRCLTFRMCSRIGCCTEELLRSEHRKLPLALFRLLGHPDPTAVQQLKDLPECMRDPWSDDFLKAYEDPMCEEALAVLSVIAATVKLDIADVECGHAAIRRHLQTRNQTHTMQFSELSGLFMAQKARTRLSAAVRGALGKRSRAKAAAGAAVGCRLVGARPAKKKKGGGGGFRVFLSQQLRLRRLKLTRRGVARMLGAEWRAMSREERAPFVATGKTATANWRAEPGRQCNSLGLARSKRAAKSKAVTGQRQQFWKRLSALPEDERLDQLVEMTMPGSTTGEQYLEAVARARQLTRDGNKAAGERLDTLRVGLYKWQSEVGADAVQALTSALGLPADRAGVLAERMTTEPADHCGLVRFDPDICTVTGDLASALHDKAEWSVVRSSLEEDRSFISLRDVIVFR